MAGTRIEIDHNLDGALQEMEALLARGTDASPAMQEIAVYLDLRTRENFDNEQGPDGTPWASLSETTLAMRAEQGISVDRILHGESLNLRDGIHIAFDSHSAEISSGQTSSPYAAMQQFGGTTSARSMIPGKEIAARPFLGLSDEDEAYILEILGDFITENR